MSTDAGCPGSRKDFFWLYSTGEVEEVWIIEVRIYRGLKREELKDAMKNCVHKRGWSQ